MKQIFEKIFYLFSEIISFRKIRKNKIFIEGRRNIKKYLRTNTYKFCLKFTKIGNILKNKSR